MGLATTPAKQKHSFGIGGGYVPQLNFQSKHVPGTPITSFGLTQDLTFPPTTELTATTRATIGKGAFVNVGYSVKATFILVKQPPHGIPVITKPVLNWERLLEAAAVAMLVAAGYGRPGRVVTP